MKKPITSVAVFALIVIVFFGLVYQALSVEPPEVEWSATYGGSAWDEAHYMIQTSDGGYALAGYSRSFSDGDSDIWLVKTDSSGYAVWNETYGGANDDETTMALVETIDGGYAIAGHTRSFGAGGLDWWLIKTDVDGNVEWNSTYGGPENEQAHSIKQTPSGDYVIAGWTRSIGAGKADFWLIKTDSNGNMLWNRTYGGADEDQQWATIVTDDGGYAMVGWSSSYGAGGRDCWFVKTDANGFPEWNMTYGGIDDDVARSLTQTDDGGYVIGGYTDSFGAGNGDFWLIKTDADGDVEWNQTYGGTSADYSRYVSETIDGGYAIAGHTQSYGSGDSDLWFVKTDGNGVVEWNLTLGGKAVETAEAFEQTSDGGYTIAGTTASFGAGGRDYWLIRIPNTLVVASVDIHPDSLNLKSYGEWITAYLELPEVSNVSDIDISSILLNETIPVDPDAPTAIGDYDEDGVLDLMVKFNRYEVTTQILNILGAPSQFTLVTLKITGTLEDGTTFEGTDIIRVIFPRGRSDARLFPV